MIARVDENLLWGQFRYNIATRRCHESVEKTLHGLRQNGLPLLLVSEAWLVHVSLDSLPGRRYHGMSLSWVGARKKNENMVVSVV